jgi:lipopolysaccharide/colanic/teichoic acid biosynthesis glycosyltransferase
MNLPNMSISGRHRGRGPGTIIFGVRSILSYYEVERIEAWQRRRLSIRPGILCLWQVNGRNKMHFDEWMKLNLEYLDNWSL